MFLLGENDIISTITSDHDKLFKDNNKIISDYNKSF